jgi:limonene-1,2-epoxide hydrolase
MDRGGIDFKVLKTVTLGPIVVNQRDDIPKEPRTINGRTISNFHVAGGVFFVDDGKIVEWTDYFFL